MKPKKKGGRDCVPLASCAIDAKARTIAIGCGAGCTSTDGTRKSSMVFRVRGKLPAELKEEGYYRGNEVKLLREAWAGWFLCVPLTLPQFHSGATNIVAVDPGVRTFATVVGTDGTVAEVGVSLDLHKVIVTRPPPQHAVGGEVNCQ